MLLVVTISTLSFILINKLVILFFNSVIFCMTYFPFLFSILCYTFVSGISLLTFMEKNRSSMCLGLVYHLVLDVIKALEYLHDHGVNHNDITPANILLIENPGVSRSCDTIFFCDNRKGTI